MQLINVIFGWPLGWIMWACFKIIPIYWLALIIFTLLVRVLLIPLSIKQQKSMIKMKLFQPKMEEIQKKYANNKQKANEEMMKLYEEEKYNPMSGCLPVLIQMPILFGVIDVIYKPMSHILRISSDMVLKAAEIAAPILQMDPQRLANDYSSQIRIMGAVRQNPQAFAGLGDFVDKVLTIDMSIGPMDLTQVPQLNHLSLLWVIPILSAATSLLSSIVMMKQTASTTGENGQAAAMNKSMMLMMPLMSGYFAFILPAGVGIYWIISNLLMAAQTILLNKFMNPTKLAEQARAEMEQRREQARKEKIEAKKQARESGETDIEKALSQKEINRLKLAAARKRDAEKYGEEYKEVTDDDLK